MRRSVRNALFFPSLFSPVFRRLPDYCTSALLDREQLISTQMAQSFSIAAGCFALDGSTRSPSLGKRAVAAE